MSQKKILIIEDDKNHIQLLREMLESNKYKILIALNGREGYEKCIREAPDVIILDILLPGESGFDILKKIKEAKTLSSIPVIILSNLGQEQEIEAGMKLGAVDYLVKTDYTIREIADKVKKVLKSK